MTTYTLDEMPMVHNLVVGDRYLSGINDREFEWRGSSWYLMADANEPKMAEKEKPVTEIPDVGSYIQAAAEELRLTLVSKNGDYAPEGEFSNFEISARFAGISEFQLMLAQIAIKMTRINNLHINESYGNNESLRDSLVDLAGYGVIAAAWLDSLAADAAKDHFSV